ncbi:DNA polymerase zeta catalytic subunit, putative [Eimeria brunetti]|uniref:DNA-directed DNA polymerase n=1 Tax=Eimeria brunetti TaxID=51314 RepID=U6M090_9EIME|nr:DNA polymerase zeta catalytic subunit, putative [Eimeria brunetti]
MKEQGDPSGSTCPLGAPGHPGSARAHPERVLGPNGGSLGMAVTAAVIEIGLDPPIRGIDPLVSEVCGRPLERVPIVRIYGPWGPGGPHCCLHLHGLFPYFYVPAPPEAYGDAATAFLRSFARRLVLEADRLVSSRARGPHQGPLSGRSRARRQEGISGPSLRRESGARGTGGGLRGGPLVHKIEVVRRLPFYGYHRDFHLFLKISLTVPDMVGPLAGLLLKGVVTGSPLQPFEVHLSFQTQVMADLHLKGMAPVFVHKPFFRPPVVLHPLAAAGVHGGPQEDNVATGGPPEPLRDDSWGALSPEFDMLGIGAARTFAALGWGRLLQQMHRLQQTNSAAESGPEAATAPGESTKSSSSSSSSAARLCELIMKATPPRGPQGLRILRAPRRSKCVIEADARVEQILNPIAATEMAEAEAAAAAAAAAQNQREPHKTQEGISSMHQEQHHQASSQNPPNNSSTINSNMNSCDRSSSSSGKAFSARLVGSVAEYWREEAERAAALGFPPPSASGWGPQGSLRDPYGAVAPELWRKALQDTLKRIDAWRQTQQHQEQERQPVHQRFPVKQNTISTLASHPKKQQQRPPQQQKANAEVIPSSLSSNWEASQLSVASDTGTEGDVYTQGSPGVSGAPVASVDAPLHPPEPKPPEASVASQGRQTHSMGLCSSQAHGGATCLLREGQPPSQRASVGLQADVTAPLPHPEDILDLAVSSRRSSSSSSSSSVTTPAALTFVACFQDLGDEAFAALLTSQGAEGPSTEAEPRQLLQSPQVSPGLAPAELQAASGGSSADCSSFSDSCPPRRASSRKRARQFPRTAPEQASTKVAQCSSIRCGQCAVNSSSNKGGSNGCSSCCNCANSSEGKRRSSDVEDLLLACEGRSAAGEGRRSSHSLWKAFSNCSLAGNTTAAQMDLPDRGNIGAPFGVSPRARNAAATAQKTKAATGLGASPKAFATAATPAPGGSEVGCSSSSYTPTVKLGPRSSCEDLSPTQPMSDSQLVSLWPLGFCGGSPQAAIAEAAAGATTAMPAAAEDGAVNSHSVGNIHVGRGSTSKNEPSGLQTSTRERPSAASESAVSVISVSPTPAAEESHAGAPPAAAVAAETSGARVEEEISPFYSNPRDVPAAVNPLTATPGGRIHLQQQGLTPPPCACSTATGATAAAPATTTAAADDPKYAERVELRSELLRFLHRQQQLQQARQPHLRQQQHLLQSGHQHDGNRCCFVYFRPPPDDAQVFGSCPLKVRRLWQRKAAQRQQQQQQQQLLLHQQQLLQDRHSSGVEVQHPDHLQPTNKDGSNFKEPVAQNHRHRQELQLKQQAQQPRKTGHGGMLHRLEWRDGQVQRTEAIKANIACPGEARDSSNSSSSSSRSRRKVCMATRLDNNGRIVSYVAPQLPPQQKEMPPCAAASQSSSSSSGSQHKHGSQVSVASDVLKAKMGLFDQAEEGTKDRKWAMGSITGPQGATYGALLALEIITECPVATATEAAAAAATPNPWNCAVLAICFVLRDERLQCCAERLQQQQQQQELLYTDVSGVIIYDPIGPVGVSCWHPPFSLGGPQRSSESCNSGRIDCLVDAQWWRCVVSSEKELLLKFCSVVAAADPSLLLQWEEGGRGFNFLGRRAAALGIGHLFKLRCSRRADDISSVPVCPGAPKAVVPGLATTSAVPGTAGAPAVPGGVKAARGRSELRRKRRWVRGCSAVSGRLVLEGWRLLQKEMKLQHSDLNGVAADVLGIIAPSIPSAIVAATWQQAQQTRRRVMQQQQQQQQQPNEDLWALQSIANLLSHVMNRVWLCLRLVDNSEVLPRTCELARLYGCSLHSALTRGSQFKVTEQPATVGVPLVLEPLSGFYFSPVLVLDFLSLYPSIVIANNICYSTCLGSVEVDPLESETKTLGVLTVHAPPQIFAQVMQAHADATAAGPSSWPSPGAPGEDPMRVLPGGSVFVSRRVRQGILPTLLNDILQTRLMVKQAAKRYQGGGIADQALLRKLDYRQFGLKMIANVTYGYTNANVSGRMPCADVADAIVETARATLIRAMQLIEQTQKWGARVLYGDTDSVFVLLKGRSLEAAFAIGKEIADAVTRSNPAPITLQLEKVYLPCCLITKKRYVGNAYFSPSGPPTFDAKGIETIRRDQCPLTSALLEKSLRIFFQTRDLSKVKELVRLDVAASTYFVHLRLRKSLASAQIPTQCGNTGTKCYEDKYPSDTIFFVEELNLTGRRLSAWIVFAEYALNPYIGICASEHISGTYRAETGEAPAGTLPPQAKVLYERLHHQGTDGGAAAGADCYGMRVPFVFSQVAGDTDVPLGSAGAGLKGGTARLIDCATSPDNVWGGRRDPTEMQALLRGRVHPCIRPFALLQQPEEDLLQQQQQQQHQEQHPVVQLHYRYYITKQIIPAIDRLFSLLPPPGSADLLQWFRDMPKPAYPLAAAMACRSPPTPQQKQQQLLRQHQQSLLQQLGIRSLTAGGASRERMVLQRFFAGASCLFCGSKCRELGSLPLYYSSKNATTLVQTSKRKKAMHASAEEAEELAARTNLVQQLLQTEFSSPGSSSSEEEDRSLPEGFPSRGKRKGTTTDLTKREITLVPPPVCKVCSSNPAIVCLRLYQRLNKIERRLAAAADLCRHCAGSRICAESCLQAWHCDVYYRRNSEAEKLKVVQHQMQNLGIFIDS